MLIDRDNLLARIDRCVSEAGKDAAQVMAIRDIKELISVMPEVDAVPVVRCKYCIHHAIVCEPNCLPRYFCTMSSKHEEVDIGFFCAFGERSEYGNHH